MVRPAAGTKDSGKAWVADASAISVDPLAAITPDTGKAGKAI